MAKIKKKSKKTTQIYSSLIIYVLECFLRVIKGIRSRISMKSALNSLPGSVSLHTWTGLIFYVVFKSVRIWAACPSSSASSFKASCASIRSVYVMYIDANCLWPFKLLELRTGFWSRGGGQSLYSLFSQFFCGGEASKLFHNKDRISYGEYGNAEKER